MSDSYDYVIVGAGSAGAVLANRLSADPANRVCVIEAGPPDRSPFIHIPVGVARLFFDPKYNWQFWSKPQAGAADRKIYVPRGKTLGGSSSINGMIYTRGDPTDYDDWAEMGAKGWSFRDVLPYFKRSENNPDYKGSPYHGQGGELHVQYLDMYSPLCEVLFKAAEDHQYRQIDDFCGPSHEGFSRRQFTIRNGVRQSTATAFLKPARKRPNLTVLTDTLTRRVLLDGDRATGVEVEHAGTVREIAADREVILCAGTINSPQILMLSGIGPGEELARHRIECRRDLPGVGRNLREHISVAVQYSSPTTVPYGLSWRTVPWYGWQALKYATTRKGIFNNPLLHAGGFIKTDPALSRPDVQLILMPAHRDAKGRVGFGHGYALIAIVLRPESHGNITLGSSDPRDAPVIDFKFFDDSSDLSTLFKGVRIARQLLESDHFAPYRGEEILPGSQVRDQAGIEDFIRKNSSTVFHPVGTCRMGDGPECVVGSDLRVKGFHGLRVADASVMPTLIGGNTNAPAIMIGEKASDMILGIGPPEAFDPAEQPERSQAA